MGRAWNSVPKGVFFLPLSVRVSGGLGFMWLNVGEFGEMGLRGLMGHEVGYGCFWVTRFGGLESARGAVCLVGRDPVAKRYVRLYLGVW